MENGWVTGSLESLGVGGWYWRRWVGWKDAIILEGGEYMEANIIDEFEGEQSVTVGDESEDIHEIYPVTVKVTRDVYSIYELKRKYEEKKTVILDPEFQRHQVWKTKQKSELIESILMGIPLPLIYLAEDKIGNLQVIDGRQRLTALFEYLNNDFKLQSLSIMEHLKGKQFKDLEPAEQSKLEDYQLIVYVIKPQTPDRIKFDIFDRVNRGGTQLNKQEMRNALYQGKSTKLLKKLSKMDEFLNATGRAINGNRMKDRYLILRFIAFYMWKHNMLFYSKKKVEYKSDIDDFLSKTMEAINNLNDKEIKNIENIFRKSMSNAFDILGEDGFRIPSTDRKRPINMALFETFGYLMSHDDVLLDKKFTKEVLFDMFEDEKFVESLTERVDSSRSVNTRFEKMDEILEKLELCLVK